MPMQNTSEPSPVPASTIDSRYTRFEEWLNAGTHGLGALLGIAALVLLIVRAVTVGRDGSLPAVILYGCALILLYSFSAIHHAIPRGAIKKVFLSLDHSGIFFLIAGTYTPFCLLLPSAQGWILLALIWSLAGLGIAVQSAAFLTGRDAAYERIAWAFHLALAWLPILFAGAIIFGALAPAGIALLAAGGAAYSIGVVFYIWKRLPYNHAIWHLFVVGGSAFHFFSIFFYVVPASV